MKQIYITAILKGLDLPLGPERNQGQKNSLASLSSFYIYHFYRILLSDCTRSSGKSLKDTETCSSFVFQTGKISEHLMTSRMTAALSGHAVTPKRKSIGDGEYASQSMRIILQKADCPCQAVKIFPNHLENQN